MATTYFLFTLIRTKLDSRTKDGKFRAIKVCAVQQLHQPEFLV